MVRICPNCNSRLLDYEYFFCTSCGNPLPDNLVLKNRNFRHVFDFTPEISKKGVTPSHFAEVLLRAGQILNLQAVLLILVIMAAFVVIFNLLFTKYGLGNLIFPAKAILKGNPLAVSKVVGKNSLDLGTNYQSHIFGADKIIEYVPSDIDLYLEANDLKALTNIFAYFKPEYKLLVEQMKGRYTSHFVVYGKSSGEKM